MTRRLPAAEPARPLHAVLTPEERRALFAEGIAHFDRGEHFEAHERFEEIWRSSRPEPRDLFQGLVLVAAGFHHLWVRRRPDVAQRVLRRAVFRLERCDGVGCGVDLEALLVALAAWDRHLDGETPEPATPFIPLGDPTRFG